MQTDRHWGKCESAFYNDWRFDRGHAHRLCHADAGYVVSYHAMELLSDYYVNRYNDTVRAYDIYDDVLVADVLGAREVPAVGPGASMHSPPKRNAHCDVASVLGGEGGGEGGGGVAVESMLDGERGEAERRGSTGYTAVGKHSGGDGEERGGGLTRIDACLTVIGAGDEEMERLDELWRRREMSADSHQKDISRDRRSSLGGEAAAAAAVSAEVCRRAVVALAVRGPVPGPLSASTAAVTPEDFPEAKNWDVIDVTMNVDTSASLQKRE